MEELNEAMERPDLESLPKDELVRRLERVFSFGLAVVERRDPDGRWLLGLVHGLAGSDAVDLAFPRSQRLDQEERKE